MHFLRPSFERLSRHLRAPFPQAASHRAGMTLVELLAGCAVFLILLVLLLQAFGTISSSTRSSRVRNELLRQAITTVERVSHDLAGVIRTGGCNLVILPDGINDSLVFLGEINSAASTSHPRHLSLIRFRVASLPKDAPALGDWPQGPAFSRDVLPLDWGDDFSTLMPFSQATLTDLLDETSSGIEQQQISPGIIRFEVRFQLWDGTLTTATPASPRDLRAVIIGIVVIEKNTFQRLSPDERKALPSHFSKASADQRPLEVWQNAITQLQPPLQSGIQIYEHTLSL